jgi:predicted transposase YdaD
MQESTVYRSIQRETTQEIALNCLRAGIDINISASSTGLSVEEVQKLQQQIETQSPQT